MLIHLSRHVSRALDEFRARGQGTLDIALLRIVAAAAPHIGDANYVANLIKGIRVTGMSGAFSGDSFEQLAERLAPGPSLQ